MFFSNIYFIDEIIYFEFRIHKISLSLEDFANILDLPHEVVIFEPEDQGHNFNFKVVASSLLKNPS